MHERGYNLQFGLFKSFLIKTFLSQNQCPVYILYINDALQFLYSHKVTLRYQVIIEDRGNINNKIAICAFSYVTQNCVS